jgi:hypothetical protein
VQLEGLGELKKKIVDIGIRSRDLLACSIVPQPPTLPCAPTLVADECSRSECACRHCRGPRVSWNTWTGTGNGPAQGRVISKQTERAALTRKVSPPEATKRRHFRLFSVPRKFTAVSRWPCPEPDQTNPHQPTVFH